MRSCLPSLPRACSFGKRIPAWTPRRFSRWLGARRGLGIIGAAIVLTLGGAARGSGPGDFPAATTTQVTNAGAGVATGAGSGSGSGGTAPVGTGGVQIARWADTETLVAADADLRQTFVITNTGSGPATIELGQMRSPSGKAITPIWIDVGSNVRLSGPHVSPARSRLLLSVSATSEESGRYTVPITVRTGESRSVYEFAIERRTQLPSGVFTARKEPSHADTAILPFFERKARVAFDVSNNGPASVQIRQPSIRAATHTVGGQAAQIGLSSVDGVITCDGDGAGARPQLVDLPQGRTCEGVVTTLIRQPGAYALTVRANGAGPADGQASVDLLLNVRAHVAWAILLAASGALIGSLVSRWQTEGRARAMAQLAISVENERVDDLVKAAKGFGYVAPVMGLSRRSKLCGTGWTRTRERRSRRPWRICALTFPGSAGGSTSLTISRNFPPTFGSPFATRPRMLPRSCCRLSRQEKASMKLFLNSPCRFRRRRRLGMRGPSDRLQPSQHKFPGLQSSGASSPG